LKQSVVYNLHYVLSDPLSTRLIFPFYLYLSIFLSLYSQMKRKSRSR
jgi:hypothetical protein